MFKNGIASKASASILALREMSSKMAAAELAAERREKMLAKICNNCTEDDCPGECERILKIGKEC